MLYSELKAKLKQLAKEIKEAKKTRKEVPDGYVYGLNSLKYEFRHHHIAYCQLRGRKREEIENPACDNKPSEYYIEQIMNSIEFPKKKEVEDEEAVCCG